MTDYENKDLTGGTDQPASPETEQPAAPETAAPKATAPETAAPQESAPAAGSAASKTPQLVLEPDPVQPEVPSFTETPSPAASAAEAFHMPEPPRAPEPPRPEQPQQEPVYQQTPPNYTQPQYGQQPQYNAPQYGNQPYQTPYQQPQYSKPLYNVPPAGYNQKSRLAAGLLGILFGCFGVHNFYLGFNSRAVTQLVVTLVGFILTFIVIGAFAVLGMYVWGFVEGILILTANNPSRMYDGNGVILRD